MINGNKIAVIIPAYKVSGKILSVLQLIGPEVDSIIVIDDACPDNSGSHVETNANDGRIVVVRHLQNKGVGGAMITGYKYALEKDFNIIVKIDGDGQIDPRLIPKIVLPIILERADYVKGNRYFSIAHMTEIPRVRMIGNIVLSFFSKLSSGYWKIFDPNNGFTAIHKAALRAIPLDKISERYFFESDMLFRLNLARAVVSDMPMKPHYADEESNLNVFRASIEFPFKYLNNYLKRIFYSYFLRDFTLASLQLIWGTIMLLTGASIGVSNWLHAKSLNITTPVGTQVLVAMLMLTGAQLLISFTSFDMNDTPTEPISKFPHLE